MAYVHNLDPFAIQFTANFGIRWYGLAYLAGFILGYYTILRLTRAGATLFKEDEIADFVTYVAIGVLAGGRLGYCLFYAPDLFFAVDSRFPYWGVLRVNEGGMASHGGIIGVMVVCWLYARAKKISVWHVIDLCVLGSSLGFMFGRIANFINGELYGREASATLAWAVKFPQEMFVWVSKEFTRLRDVAPAVDALGSIHTENGDLPVNASVWQSWLDSYGRDLNSRSFVHETLEQIIGAIQGGNEAVRVALAPALTPRHPSQLYQMFLEGFLVFVILMFVWRKPQKPGVVSGWFGVLYCVARIIGEQFRMPDAHIGFQLFGLTRGQWLSFGFLMAAIMWLIWAYRSDRPKLGGWFPDEEAKKAARKAMSVK